MSSYTKAASRLNKDLHAVVRDTEALLAATGDLAGDQVEAVRTRARKSLKAMREGLQELPGEFSEQLHDAGEAVESAIRGKPLQWVGIAAAGGLLLGILSMVRSR
jgi:ElaB/YqjD/DUF883 family membrane-anchored ribosome-binding protein